MKQMILLAAVAVTIASCQNNDTAARQQQATIDSLKNDMARKQLIDSVNQAAQMQQMQPVTTETRQVSTATRKSTGHGTSTVTNNTTTNYSNGGGQPVAATQPKQKKGWSAKAKGAVIGAGVGAVTGAMVDKKKGEGAIIGGVLGAGAGTGVGAIIDKKDGR